MARTKLKQLTEECCTEADALGHVDGAQRLEDHLHQFLSNCNEIKSSHINIFWSGNTSKDGNVGVTVPMANGKNQK